MQCPKCRFENPDAVKFCGECGAKLEKLCTKCNAANPPQFKFCGECGHALGVPAKAPPKELSFDEKLAKIQKYLPGGLTEKILAQRGKIEGERKQVTVMFTDMEGFTPLVEKIGPEEAYGIMDQVYEILLHKVHEYEGTVNKMTGDGIMALFGAPIALEDAPQRAIRAAHAIHREMARFSDRLKEEKGLPSIKMRIGLHTGPVVVGTLGNDLRVEFTAVGDTVNLASRIQDLAEAGKTYVSGETFKITEGLFRFESLGERKVKGREESVRIFEVIAPTSIRTRFDVSAERGLTPFVGRSREMELLLDGLGRAREGRGQAFSIIGEAGVGKSRVLYEFRKAVANENITFLEGKCLSYGRGASYHPITDILRGAFDLREGDGDSKVRERVQDGLRALKMETASALPFVLGLLGIKDSGIEKISMSPEGKKDRIIETVKQILLRSSEIRSLVIAIEDLHWADRSTEDVVKYLLDVIPAGRVLLLFTYRPEFVHTWGGKSYHNQLTLNRLSNRETLVMAASLLGTPQVDKEIEELILERTEGVPFFIEEFIRSLRDLNIIQKEESRYRLVKNIQNVKIPSTIQDMILARVDALPPNAKEFLQTGSVIEREFSHELIKKVTGLDDKDLFAGFSFLKDAELIYERGIFPQSTYIFKHALTREVVYDSLVALKKKRLHAQIGKAVEEIFKDHLLDCIETLAHHYLLAENYEKAAEYSRLASRKAEKGVSLFRAISFAEQNIACLEKLPVTQGIQRTLVDARTRLGLYYTQMNQERAKAAIDPILDLALKLNYKKRLCQIYTILGAYHAIVTENISEAIKTLEHAVKLAEETKDPVSQVLAGYYYAGCLAGLCQFDKSAEFYQRGYEINLAAGSLWGASAMLSSFAIACLLPQGKIEEGFRTTEKGIDLAEKSGDAFSRGTSYLSHGISNFYKGYLQEAEVQMQKGFQFRNLIPFHWYGLAQGFLGLVYFEMGEMEKSKRSLAEAISAFADHSLQPSFVPFLKGALMRAKIANHETDIDWGFLTFIPSSHFMALSVVFYQFMGDIYLHMGVEHLTEAELSYRKAIEIGEEKGTKPALGHSLAAYGRLIQRKGDRAKARENLGRAIEIMKECGADGWVDKYEKELASMA